MRTLLVAAFGLVVVFVHNPAQAQSPSHNWSGFYAGLHAGGTWGDTHVDVGCNDANSIFAGFCALAAPSGLPPSGFSPDMSGYLGGGQAGYNFQSGNWVFGVEADVSWTDADGAEFRSIGGGGSSNVSQELDWLGTVRGRVGWASENWLLYATGGLAYGRVENRYHLDAGGDTADDSHSDTQAGWTIGGGAEIALGQWSLKGEYLFFDLGSESLNAEGIDNPGATPARLYFPADFDTQGHIARIGLNYHFD